MFFGEMSDPRGMEDKILRYFSAAFTCCHHILNLYLFLYSNTTKEMLFIIKRDELSLFYMKRLSPAVFLVCTFSIVKISLTYLTTEGISLQQYFHSLSINLLNTDFEFTV